MEEFALIVPDEGHRRPITGKRHGDRARALFEPLLAHQRILRQIVNTQLGEWLGVKLLDLRKANAMREKALIRLQQLPQREALYAWDDELHRALTARPTSTRSLSFLRPCSMDFREAWSRTFEPMSEERFWSRATMLFHRKLSPPLSFGSGER